MSTTKRIFCIYCVVAMAGINGQALGLWLGYWSVIPTIANVAWSAFMIRVIADL